MPYILHYNAFIMIQIMLWAFIVNHFCDSAIFGLNG